MPRGSSERDPRLEKYDRLSIRAFIIGSITALLIGVFSASYQLINKEVSVMFDKQKSSNTGRTSTLKESVNGITNLNPDTIVRSLNGITNLKPQAPQTQSNTQTQDSSGSSSSVGKKEKD